MRQRAAMTAALTIKPLGSRDTGRCACCGRVSRAVWGLVDCGDKPHGSYFVHWTVGHVFENGAHFAVILRGRDNEANATERYAVSLEYRVRDNGPEFMVVDAVPDRVAKIGALADRFLKRNDVIGGPLAKTVFDICDAALAQDKRLTPLWEAPEGS